MDTNIIAITIIIVIIIIIITITITITITTTSIIIRSQSSSSGILWLLPSRPCAATPVQPCDQINFTTRDIKCAETIETNAILRFANYAATPTRQHNEVLRL